MEHKCSCQKVFRVFVQEPLKIHYVKEISRKINLAPTSVKLHLENLEKDQLIIRKRGERFLGFIANRDNKDFLFYKKIENLIILKESGLIDFLEDSNYPQTIVLYGSYLKGEDIKSSDIDLLLITGQKKKIIIPKFEEKLKRKVHIIVEKKLDRLPTELQNEVINGLVLYGYLK